MSNTPQPPKEPQILGTFASLIGLLGIFLYFTGWLYRWAYYSFFQLEITRLNLPLRSFLFVPIQVFLGDIWAFGRTTLVVITAVVLMKFTLWLLQPLNSSGVNHSNQRTSHWTKYAQKLHGCWLAQILRSLAEVFPRSLLNDTIIVTWLLVALFWLARIQGTIDARRDAINDTSLLPVITLVTPEKDLVLGRNLDNVSTCAKLFVKKWTIFHINRKVRKVILEGGAASKRLRQRLSIFFVGVLICKSFS